MDLVRIGYEIVLVGMVLHYGAWSDLEVCLSIFDELVAFTTCANPMGRYLSQ